ncbi:MAG: zinc ABC transporter substrate-binding protein [Gemmataceae bacterium]|nr:zinc ABC transporter substrate-binding protein [Gemmataceae bacterium]
MNRKQLGLFSAGACALLALALFLGGCGKNANTSDADVWPDRPGPKVVVSFAPLYCFAANVAGDDAVVKNVMTSKGPHDFDPTAQDVRLVTKADVFFVVGLNLDNRQAAKMKKGSGNDNLQLIELGAKLNKRDLCEGRCTHTGPDHTGHDHGIDPHVWLSPDHAAKFTAFIRDELKAADPAHANAYHARAAAYLEKLQAIKDYGVEKFKGKTDKRLVSFHDSLAYFEEAFQLDVRAVLTKTPGQEPDAKEMSELIKICTKPSAPTRVIVTEPQYSTSNSGAALQKELAAKGVAEPMLVEFDTLETVRPDDLTPDWYERKMRQNIDALAKVMK